MYARAALFIFPEYRGTSVRRMDDSAPRRYFADNTFSTSHTVLDMNFSTVLPTVDLRRGLTLGIMRGALQFLLLGYP